MDFIIREAVPAIRFYESFGFTVEGSRRKFIYQDGEYFDDHMMALLL